MFEKRTSILVLALLVLAIFGTQAQVQRAPQGPAPGPNTRPGGVQQPGPGGPGGMGQQGGPGGPAEGPGGQARPADPWIRVLDLEGIVKKYNLERERIQLDQREALLPIEEKGRKLFEELQAAAYTDGKAGTVVDLTRQIHRTRREAEQVGERMRERMQDLAAREQKDIDAALETWLGQLATDKDLMSRYLKLLTERRGR